MQKFKFLLAIIFTMFAFTSFAHAAQLYQTEHKQDISKQDYYTIKLNYPVFKNVPHSEDLNNLVQLKIDDAVKTFKKNIDNDPDLAKRSGIPHNVNSNTLTVNYKVTQVNQHLASIRFSFDTYFYASAHPMTNFQSLNFDFNQGKEIGLHDLFKDQNYLSFLSKFSKKVLTKKLSQQARRHTEPADEGLKPVDASFQVWNLTPKGLLLTFPPYQVAAYVFGEQEVLVPYAKLKPTGFNMNFQ